MGDFDIDWDVDGIDKTIKALLRGLERGLEDTGNTLQREGKDKAIDEITGARRVWTEEVKNSFKSKDDDSIAGMRNYVWRGSIINTAKHADVVDRGLAPAGEITGSEPSVQDILPWVVANLSPADYDGGNGDPGFSPGPPYDGDGGITDEDRTFQSGDLEDFGLRSDSFESKYVKAGSLSDGSKVVWKSHYDEQKQLNVQDWKVGIIKNEIVWSKAQEKLDYDLGPRSRSEVTDTTQGEWEGTIQEFVEGNQLSDQMYSGYGDRSEFEDDYNSFLDKNMEWAAKTNAIDYIVGNDDRHKNNIRVDPEGRPRAIDNGGNQFNEKLRGKDLAFLSDFFEYYGGDDRQQRQHELNQEFLDETERVIEEILNDDDFIDSLIETVGNVHGENSKEYERIKRVIGDDVGKDHILAPGEENGDPLYKRHLDITRNRHERIYNGGDYYVPEEDDPDADKDGDGEIDDGWEFDGNDQPTMNLEDDLDNLFGGLDEEET